MLVPAVTGGERVVQIVDDEGRHPGDAAVGAVGGPHVEQEVAGGVGEPATVVVPRDDDVTEPVDGRRRHDLEAVVRAGGDGAAGPVRAVVGGAGDDDVCVVPATSIPQA